MGDDLTNQLRNGKLDGAYRQMRAIATRLLRHEFRKHLLSPTALVHEVFVRRIAGKKLDFQDRHHFYALITNAMRQTLIDEARGMQAAKRNSNGQLAPPIRQKVDLSPEEMLTLDLALEELRRLDPRAFRVVELRYLLGHNVEEAAGIIGCEAWQVKEDWDFARVWLRDRIDRQRPESA